VSDEEAIRTAIARYFHLLDDRDFDEWRKLLTEDVAITINGVDRWPPSVQITGQRGQHIAANTAVEVDGETATALTDYFYIGEIGPAKFERLEILDAGRYTIRLVRHEGRWLLREVAMKVFYFDR
jgi:SnoaL-like domain